MNESQMLPLFCQTEHQLYFIKINEDNNLCLYRSNAQGEWGQDEILLQDCHRFVAAPDAKDGLHVITANSKNKLHYFLITKDQVKKEPFFISESSGLFLFSFSSSGPGYLFVSEENNSGKLTAAKYLSGSGWSEDVSLGQSHSVPVSLAIDKNGGLHLILYDLTNGNLNYNFRSQGAQRWAEPFRLDNALQMTFPPALWIDASQNLHIAWYVPRSNTICYRIKKAGGWPVGGWQPEHYLPMDVSPRLISFHEESQRIKLWCFRNDRGIDIFSQQNGDWQKMREETDFRLPVRHGILGSEIYNLAQAVPTNNWYFIPLPERTGDEVIEHKDEQEEKLLGQIIQLMEEKRSMKALLQKKEESLAQYRLMLERSHENANKQRSEWKETTNQVDDKLRHLEEELLRRDRENKLLKEQFEQAQNKLTAQEVSIKDYRAEILPLRVKLAHCKKEQAALRATISKLEKELQSRKGVWEVISSAFHKKE